MTLCPKAIAGVQPGALSVTDAEPVDRELLSVISETFVCEPNSAKSLCEIDVPPPGRPQPLAQGPCEQTRSVPVHNMTSPQSAKPDVSPEAGMLRSKPPDGALKLMPPELNVALVILPFVVVVKMTCIPLM